MKAVTESVAQSFYSDYFKIGIMTEHYVNYRKYLISTEWKAIRLDIIQLRVSCERCGSDKRLEVHHKTYKRLFNENPNDLELLCKSCHTKHHKDERRGIKKRVKKKKVKNTKLKTKKKLHDYSLTDITNIRKKKKNYRIVKMAASERQRILDRLNQ